MALFHVDRALAVLGALCHAALAATKSAPPLKVEEGKKHNRESNIDCDDHWIVNLLFIGLHESLLLEIVLKGPASLIIGLTSCNNIDLIRALKHDFHYSVSLLNVFGCDDLGN